MRYKWTALSAFVSVFLNKATHPLLDGLSCADMIIMLELGDDAATPREGGATETKAVAGPAAHSSARAAGATFVYFMLHTRSVLVLRVRATKGERRSP